VTFLYFLLDQTLNEIGITARSPPSAYYIKMQRVLPNYSKKADLYEITLGLSIDANSLT